MKKIIIFLLSFLLLLTLLLILDINALLPPWLNNNKLVFRCILSAGFGGVVYCLRAIYLNACVMKQWDVEWQPWYYIRPFVSLVMGGASYLFLKAGLLVLEGSQQSASSNYGFLALAFIAGLNVDKFLKKIEEISQSIWGIEKSRVSDEKEKNE